MTPKGNKQPHLPFTHSWTIKSTSKICEDSVQGAPINWDITSLLPSIEKNVILCSTEGWNISETNQSIQHALIVATGYNTLTKAAIKNNFKRVILPATIAQQHKQT